MINRGSEYKKWDLHIHSPFTILNNNFEKIEDGSPDIDKFIKKIKDEKIDVIGLTNYFNFTENDFELKRKLERFGVVTFLNLEVRLSNINKEDQLFDYHVIFDPLLDDQILKNLLGQLKANIGSTEKSFNTLTYNEVEKLANVSFNDLIKVLSSDKELNGRYLKGFLSRGHGSATSDKDSKNQAVYENICVNSDFIIHSSCNDPKTCSDKKCKHNNLKKDREFWLGSKYVRPLLQSSDAHSIEKIGKKYSWIKSDLTFEGLKQIKYEPEFRICLDKEKPSLKKDELVIDYIEYKGKKLFLSENLNSIIGGRSTGKSTLLNSIAKKLGNTVDVGNYYFEDIDNFKVYWRDGKEDDSRKIHYIPQEYMFSLAKDNEKLKSLVGEIIQSKGIDFQLRNYEMKCSNLQREIKNLIHGFKENMRFQEELISPEAEKGLTEARIEAYENKKKELLEFDSFKDDERVLVEEKRKLLDHLIKENKNLDDDLNIVNNLQLSDTNFIIENFLNPSNDLQTKINSIIEDIKNLIADKFSSELFVLKNKLNRKLIENTKIIQELENDSLIQKYNKYLEKNFEILKLEELIKLEYHILSEINAFENKKQQLVQEEKDIKKEIIDKYKEYTKYREDLQNSFKINEEDDLTISIKFSLCDLYAEFDYINGRGNSKQLFIENMYSDFDSVVDSIFDDNSLVFNGNKNHFSHLEYFLNKNFYHYHFDIEYQNDKFDQMSPGKKSFIVLKLILDYSESKIPVLIDQPEDSLDNRAIYSELTTYIKKTKLNRQIILVTHNPNIVVTGDCENIIVANKDSNNSQNENGLTFDYINGSLESSIRKPESNYILQKFSIKEHVCDILEGGQTAFLKHENKYNIHQRVLR
ncbi:TrlF family AAA-like ATPase [Streptococcus porcinus]|uniref:TrlF family AAA-like ATPase n=1 Tax=Streptococcus porcinus TaxID=1340 RepID=UPI00196123CA|nr:ATPase [Streptococcus porcinus]